MACFHPLTAFRGPTGIVFNVMKSYRDVPSFKVPCGQCVGCRLERSRQWAIRCMHEAATHENNCFITLTYAPEHLPPNGSLHLPDFQRFMKRLRKKYGNGIRFYHCGEYGEKLNRPHYHALLFGHDFPDKKYFTQRNNLPVFTSDSLLKLWPYGIHEIGSVTFESAAYCARYIMKKITGAMASDHYSRIDPETGEVFYLSPEYTTMSRRDGIGKAWFNAYHDEVYPSDEVIVNGSPVRPPKYYDSQYELLYPDEFVKLKSKRVKTSRLFSDNNTKDRLSVREKVQLSKLKSLVRKLEN